MCTMSMIADHYLEKPHWPLPIPGSVPIVPDYIPRAEFDQLKRDVEEMKALLKRAKKYDEDTGQPDCETAEKMEVLRKVAELVGVDLTN